MSVDILLVNPLILARDPVEQRLMTPYFPLGLLYLAATLRRARYQVAVYDGTFSEDISAFRQAIEEHRPRVVGLGILTTVRDNAIEMAEMAREAGIPVIVGGSDPTGRPESYLQMHNGERPAADVVVLGEAEETILELLPALLGDPGARPLEKIPGLVFLDESGETVRTPARPLCSDVDAIPFPARDLVDMEAYQRHWRSAHGYSSLSVIAGRGCPFECAWCQKSVFGRSLRLRSPESVAEEMLLIKSRYGVDQLRLVDDVTGIDRRWVRAFRDAVLAKDARIPFECLSRVDLVDWEMLTWLREAGCTRISFGAESGSQRVLDAMTKGTRVEQIREAAMLCHELGIEVYFYIMVGYPEETWSDIKATVRLLRETIPDEFSSTIAYPLPGTPFYERVRDELVEAPDWRHTAENRALYKGTHSTQFYRWVQRLLRKEWQAARLSSGIATETLLQRLRTGLSLVVIRAIVWLLRLAPADARPVPDAPPCQ